MKPPKACLLLLFFLFALAATTSAQFDTGNGRLTDWFQLIDWFIRSKVNETAFQHLANEDRECWKEKLNITELGEKQINKTSAIHMIFQAANLCVENRTVMMLSSIDAFDFRQYGCCKHELFELEPKAAILDGYDDSEWDGERELCETKPCIKGFHEYNAKHEAEVGNYENFMCNVVTREQRTLHVYKMKIIKFGDVRPEVRNAEIAKIADEYVEMYEAALKCFQERLAAL